MWNRCIVALYVTLMQSKEDLNCYFFRIIYSNNLNSDNVNTKLQPVIIVCKQWHQRKRGEKKNADYCRAYRKKKAEEYRRKDRERKQFQRDYRKYVSDPAKYEEFKR